VLCQAVRINTRMFCKLHVKRLEGFKRLCDSRYCCETCECDQDNASDFARLTNKSEIVCGCNTVKTFNRILVALYDIFLIEIHYKDMKVTLRFYKKELNQIPSRFIGHVKT